MKYVPPTVSFWKYDLGDGWEAWAGKTAEDNDLLSLRVATPEDFWFHICGMSGSHSGMFVIWSPRPRWDSA